MSTAVTVKITAGVSTVQAHLAFAFHFAHGWSHTRALAATAAQTAEVTGIGTGVGERAGCLASGNVPRDDLQVGIRRFDTSHPLDHTA